MLRTNLSVETSSERLPHPHRVRAQTLTDVSSATKEYFHTIPAMWLQTPNTALRSPYSSSSCGSTTSKSSLFDSVASPESADSLPQSPSTEHSPFAICDKPIDASCLTEEELRLIHRSDALAALEDRRCDIQLPWEAPSWMEWLKAAAEDDRPFYAFGNCRRKRLSPMCPSVIEEDESLDVTQQGEPGEQEEQPHEEQEQGQEQEEEQVCLQSQDDTVEQQRIKDLHDTLAIRTVAAVNFEDFVDRVNSIPFAKEGRRVHKQFPLEPHGTDFGPSTSTMARHAAIPAPHYATIRSSSRQRYLSAPDVSKCAQAGQRYSALGLFIPQQDTATAPLSSRRSLPTRRALSLRSILKSSPTLPNFSKKPLAPVPEVPQTLPQYGALGDPGCGLEASFDRSRPLEDDDAQGQGVQSTWSDSSISGLAVEEPATLFKRVGHSVGDLFKSFARVN